MPHVHTAAQPIRHRKAQRARIHAGVDQTLRRVHPAIATEDDEGRCAKGNRGGHDPSDTSDHHGGIPDGRQQLACIQFPMRESQIARRHDAALEDFSICLNVADDHGREASGFQVTGDISDILRDRVAGQVVPFQPPQYRAY